MLSKLCQTYLQKKKKQCSLPPAATMVPVPQQLREAGKQSCFSEERGSYAAVAEPKESILFLFYPLLKQTQVA